MSKGNRVKNRLKTRNRILALSATFISAFVIYTVAFYSYKEWQWDAIFPYVLGIGGVVDVMTAAIAIADKIGAKGEKNDEI